MHFFPPIFGVFLSVWLIEQLTAELAHLIGLLAICRKRWHFIFPITRENLIDGGGKGYPFPVDGDEVKSAE